MLGPRRGPRRGVSGGVMASVITTIKFKSLVNLLPPPSHNALLSQTDPVGLCVNPPLRL